MRGRVLSFDGQSGDGMISGDDGQRYAFGRADLRGGATTVLAGSVVDFQVAEGRAVEVYSVAPAMGDKNRIAAALLAFFLGTLGIHKFYLGRTNAGIITLLCGTVGWILVGIPPAIVWVISIVEFIIYLTKSDEQFYQDYVVGQRAWF
jgi:TM2 domain-containing membrane protein YozV